MSPLNIGTAQNYSFDLIAFGEVMLRMDPGDERIHTASHFRVWEGGGEYNVARGLSKCFGLKTAVATSLVDNSIGRLAENLILKGGVDASNILWDKFDKIGRASRNGIYFAERGFGIRGALGVMDRGHTAVSQLEKGDIDWESIFCQQGAKWLHTGGIMAGLSQTMPDVIEEAMLTAKKHGVIVSYDLNYRPSLWENFGGLAKAQEINSRLARFSDVLLGFGIGADLDIDSTNEAFDPGFMDPAIIKNTILKAIEKFPNIKLFATTVRNVTTAGVNDLGGICWFDGNFYESPLKKGLQVLDRIGSGDSFAAGIIYGFLTDKTPQNALDYGVAHGALALTTPGDQSMATLEEVKKIIQEDNSSIVR